jgi:ComF family protein
MAILEHGSRREPQSLAGWREAVFSSTGFRIRAAQGQAANHRFACWAEDTAASLFFTLFPADCRICGAPLIRISRLPVCEPCLSALRPMAGSLCTVCGEALFSPAFVERGEACCGLCRRLHPPFERAVAYGSYEGGLRDLIHLLKYQQVRPAAQVLGRMLAETIAALEAAVPAGAILVVSVPLHARKQAQRGFNQSELIARAALRLLARPERFEFSAGVLRRQRETSSQIGLTRHQRRENLRGAFAVTSPERVANRDILLVDDVLTTGTTASECARVLRRAGACRVWVATVARTLKASDVFAVPADEREEIGENRHTLAAHG